MITLFFPVKWNVLSWQKPSFSLIFSLRRPFIRKNSR